MVTVNRRQSGKLYDANGRPLYCDDNRARPSTDPNISDFRVPRKATQVYGALWNVPRERSGVTVLFVTAGPLRWKPVSREEFYRANLYELEGANGEKLAAYRAGLQKTAYEQFLEGAAQRRANCEKAMAHGGKAQRMQAFMMKNPQAAAMMMQAEQAAGAQPRPQ